MAQVSAVVQTNAATAEENSATSEEMSAQAVTLQEEVGKFKLDTYYTNDSLSQISLLKEPKPLKRIKVLIRHRLASTKKHKAISKKGAVYNKYAASFLFVLGLS